MTWHPGPRRLGWLAASAGAALAALLLWRAPWSAEPRPGRRAEPASAEGDALAGPLLEGVARAEPKRQAAAALPEPARDEAASPPPAGIALRVSAFDIHTGESVSGMWSPAPGPVATKVMWMPRAEFVDWAAFDRDTEEQQRRFDASFVPLGAASPGVLDPLVEGMRVLGLRLDPYWVALPHAVWISASVAAGVREATARVPVAREALLEVCLVAPDGTPAEGAALPEWRLCGDPWPARVEPLGPGCYRVRGIPHLPGAWVSSFVAWPPAGAPPARAEPPERPFEGDRVEPEPPLRTTVPESLAEPWRVTLRLSGPVAAPERNHVEVEWDRLLDDPKPAVQEGPRGKVRVKALDAAGRANPNALVSGWHAFHLAADPSGTVLVEGVETGSWEFQAEAPGHLTAYGEVEVVAGREAVLVLREPVGARLVVSVVDREGCPRPGAALWLGAPCFDVVGDVQRLDFACDEDGRRSFQRVRPGPCRIRASWGGQRGEDEVTLLDEETTRVELVVR